MVIVLTIIDSDSDCTNHYRHVVMINVVWSPVGQ